jgi:hypothetical protein
MIGGKYRQFCWYFPPIDVVFVRPYCCPAITFCLSIVWVS